jgi:hypothetical protein
MKFIITITGPAMTYRLDIIKRASPTLLKDFIIIFTNSYSYELYKDYHNDFKFVIMDGYRNRYPNLLDKELFFDSPTQEHYFDNVAKFYSEETRILYPYDAQRFIFLYLAENNILDFCIIDSDFILNDSIDMINFIFDRQPEKSMCTAWFGLDGNAEKRISFLNTYIKPSYPSVDFSLSNTIAADGYLRGFKFENTDHMLLFFNIWNSCIDVLLSDDEFRHIFGGRILMDTAWVCPYIMQIFGNMGYKRFEMHHFLDVEGKRVGVHCTRPEDTFYFGERGNWTEFEFDYSGINNISSFVSRNKKKLRDYYEPRLEIIEITDTHVYNKVR